MHFAIKHKRKLNFARQSAIPLIATDIYNAVADRLSRLLTGILYVRLSVCGTLVLRLNGSRHVSQTFSQSDNPITLL